MLNEYPYLLTSFIFGLIAGLLLPLVIITLLSGCASTDNIPKCTWICPTNNIPVDCYCLEEEINREAGTISPTNTPNGFHP